MISAHPAPRFTWLRDRLLRTRRPRSRRSHPAGGFTLMELLVALLMGSIVTGALLYATVEILQINQREDNRAETQREMKVALDFISNELREAVFVYDGNCLTGAGGGNAGSVRCPGVLNYLPALINAPPTTIPAIAFWRVDELPNPLVQACAANATQLYADPIPPAINGVPCLSRRSYSLVVYYLDTANPNGTWRGQARIRRYELTQFNPDGSRNRGWVDPTITANNFLGWPLDTQGNNLQTQGVLPDDSPNLAVGAPSAAVNPTVLVDFVDTPTLAGNGNTAIACPTDTTNRQTRLPPFVRTPTTGSPSFYGCVRGGGIDTSQAIAIPNNPGGRNQEIALFLRGNAAGRPGLPANARQTFEIETRVLTRGSYEKTPAPQ